MDQYYFVGLKTPEAWARYSRAVLKDRRELAPLHTVIEALSDAFISDHPHQVKQERLAELNKIAGEKFGGPDWFTRASRPDVQEERQAPVRKVVFGDTLVAEIFASASRRMGIMKVYDHKLMAA